MNQDTPKIDETAEAPTARQPWVIPAMTSLNASATEFNPGPFGGDAEGAS